jgi:hypothetical protein
MTKKKRKTKNSHSKRLRAMLTGATITFDGNDNDQLEYKLANGLPMASETLRFIIDNKWRWKLTLGLQCHLGGAIRTQQEDIEIGQVCYINDLTDFVYERHEIMALESPDAWEAHAAIWTAKILG